MSANPTARHFDPTDIFAALNAERVKYLVFGGIAVVLYGVGRLTWDVDIVLKLTATNVDRLTKALKKIGFQPRVPAPPSGLADPSLRRKWIREKRMQVYPFREQRSPSRIVDVMIKPLKDFESLYDRRTLMKVRGVSIPLIPVDALLRLKKAAGRPQDLQDIQDLKRLHEK